MENLFDEQDVDYVQSVSKPDKDPEKSWANRNPRRVASLINAKTDSRAVAQIPTRGGEVKERSVFVFVNENEAVPKYPSSDKVDFTWKASCDAKIEQLLDYFQNGGEENIHETLNDIWNE